MLRKNLLLTTAFVVAGSLALLATQDWAIAFCVIPLTAHHTWIGVTVIWIAVVLTLYTGWQYYAQGKKVGLRAS